MKKIIAQSDKIGLLISVENHWRRKNSFIVGHKFYKCDVGFGLNCIFYFKMLLAGVAFEFGMW